MWGLGRWLRSSSAGGRGAGSTAGERRDPGDRAQQGSAGTQGSSTAGERRDPGIQHSRRAQGPRDPAQQGSAGTQGSSTAGERRDPGIQHSTRPPGAARRERLSSCSATAVCKARGCAPQPKAPPRAATHAPECLACRPAPGRRPASSAGQAGQVLAPRPAPLQSLRAPAAQLASRPGRPASRWKARATPAQHSTAHPAPAHQSFGQARVQVESESQVGQRAQRQHHQLPRVEARHPHYELGRALAQQRAALRQG